MAAETLLRGRVLRFVSEPKAPDDHGSYLFDEDGGVLIKDGKVKACGAFASLRATAPDATLIDHRPHLILPGFIDTHLHFVQMQVIASWGAQLLDWLNNYTFPAETEFSDPAHGARIADAFFDEMLRHGTTTPVAYCSSHPQSAEAYFTAAAARNMRVIGGKVMMDRNAPPALCDTAQRGHDETEALVARWHGKGRAEVAITPRFAITSTPEQLEAAGALARAHPTCPVQTHLSENHDEISSTLGLYPKAKDYLDIYHSYGLLGPRSLMGHSIHLSPREMGVMAETGAVAVFCPTSNLFLGSGLYNEAGLAEAGVRRAIATDIGGGTNYSMLRTLDEGYKVLALRGQKLTALKAFYWITLGNARALGLEGQIGTLAVGSEADITVLNPAATPAMALRHARVETLAEELFLLQVLGDDRAVVETYAAGVARKPG